MAKVQVRPTVRYLIFKAADQSLWAVIPQFGIERWRWRVGDVLGCFTRADLGDAHEEALEDLRVKIWCYCEWVVRAVGVHGPTSEQRELAQQILDHGFELLEDPSIPT